jgi:hypothetical protein
MTSFALIRIGDHDGVTINHCQPTRISPTHNNQTRTVSGEIHTKAAARRGMNRSGAQTMVAFEGVNHG